MDFPRGFVYPARLQPRRFHNGFAFPRQCPAVQTRLAFAHHPRTGRWKKQTNMNSLPRKQFLVQRNYFLFHSSERAFLGSTKRNWV